MVSARLLYYRLINENYNGLQSPAIHGLGKETLSYQELFQHLHSTALQLNRLGVRTGDRLAVVLPNGPEMATAFLAISSVCTYAPLNPSYLVEEFKFSLEDLHVKALVTLPGRDYPAQ